MSKQYEDFFLTRRQEDRLDEIVAELTSKATFEDLQEAMQSANKFDRTDLVKNFTDYRPTLVTADLFSIFNGYFIEQSREQLDDEIEDGLK